MSDLVGNPEDQSSQNEAHIVASVLYCSIYHCTTFEKNEIEKFGIIIFEVLFIRDLRIIPEGENMSIQ